MQAKNYALEEEMQIFKTFCPKLILEKIENKNVSFMEYRNISLALLCLGFSEISDMLLENIPHHMEEERLSLNNEINKEEILKICSFLIDNIGSKGLRDIFEASVDYHISTF